MVINWYPGHMAKAKRMIAESVAQVDMVAELLDARIPYSSRNADFETLFASKKRLIILNKTDLADEAMTKRWEEEYRKQGFSVFSFCSVSGGGKKALDGIAEAAKEIVERYKAKGVNKTVRILIAGIPNVGKSAFINSISRGAKAKTGDKPGVTRGKQWVKVTPYLELLDTPGILWPKLEDQECAARLAYVGCINDEILQSDKLCAMLLTEIGQRYPKQLFDKYGVEYREQDGLNLLQEICKKRGFLLPGAELDMRRGAAVVLDEFRGGKIGKMTLDELRSI